MMVMTAKVDLKKILLLLAAVAGAILAVVLLTGQSAAPTGTAALSGNDARVALLEGFGWEVEPSPTESSRVKIPTESGEAFRRYNLLQKGQGYDLSQYAGKTVMRYVYRITNYPGATEPVYATLLVYKNRVIGGDITDTAPGGRIHSLQLPKSTEPAE